MGSVVFGAILSTFCEELQVFVRRGRARRIVITYMCMENLEKKTRPEPRAPLAQGVIIKGRQLARMGGNTCRRIWSRATVSIRWPVRAGSLPRPRALVMRQYHSQNKQGD